MDINYQEEVAQGAWVHTLLKANKGIKIHCSQASEKWKWLVDLFS